MNARPAAVAAVLALAAAAAAIASWWSARSSAFGERDGAPVRVVTRAVGERPPAPMRILRLSQAETVSPWGQYVEAWRQTVERDVHEHPPVHVTSLRRFGSPVISVRILPDGRLAGASVEFSSGSPELDAAALAALDRVAPFAAFPDAVRADADMVVIRHAFVFAGPRGTGVPAGSSK